jgi:hypothetical protein
MEGYVMFSSYFFKGSWLIQLIVGIGLFLCSFFLEYRILLSFLSPQYLALFLAITLERGKVSAIIWHYYLVHLSSREYPGSIRSTSFFFRLGLMFLSLLCSQLYLSAHLDRPNLEKVRKGELQAIEQGLNSDRARLEKLFLKQKSLLIAQQKAELATGLRQWDARIQKLDFLLLSEMDNVVNGIFKGARYKEFEQRLTAEKANRRQAMEEMRSHHARRLDDLDSFYFNRRKNVENESSRKRQYILSKDYATDERANDPHIIAFMKVLDSLFHKTLLPLQFVFFFSLLLSGLMEAGILLAFSTVTIAVAPVFKVHLEEAVEKEAMMARVTGEAEREDFLHGAAINRIHKTGKYVVKKAKAFMKKQQQKDIMDAG